MNINLQLEGRYKLRRVSADTGETVWESTWCKNLITNIGLNRCGTDQATAYCFVGSGNATPAITDQKLSIFIAGATGGPSGGSPTTVYTQSPAAPWWGGFAKTWRFAMGAAAGNISEVGVGWGGATDAAHFLFSRALIVDGSGNPTTITILPTEYLDVTYEFRMYLPDSDVVFDNIDVFGNMHKFTVRGYGQSAASDQGNLPDIGFKAWQARLLSGATLGPITGTMSGVTVPPDRVATLSAYTANSLKRGCTVNYSISEANAVAGISGIVLSHLSGTQRLPKFQILIEPPIMKTANDTVAFYFELSWARRP